MDVWEIVRDYRNVMERADADGRSGSVVPSKYGGYQDPQPGDADYCPSMAQDVARRRN